VELSGKGPGRKTCKPRNGESYTIEKSIPMSAVLMSTTANLEACLEKGQKNSQKKD